MENVFITPQSAWMSEWNAENAARQVVLPNLRHWLAGEPDQMINVVKP
jgi:phosphoglycerate dehydrogenase-like enzyme